MGKKSKIGRQRRDRFYHLAKETGFRSRAAFKLLQLNRKFEFLQKSRVLIDLCAAPGGWMQVAKQNMPVSSIVVGIDMYPMKPVPGCISLLEDITTDKCRVSLQRELKTWKADVVLHDGAPNLGKNWLHDAYNQNCLTLSALKLATQFLKSGGWFVSKVFRSKDYNCLLWVFKQLFQKVHATKPPASRNESAEIFVVCERYLAPASIDPKMLNANYVFKEFDSLAPAITIPGLIKAAERTKKSKAEGYDETALLHARLPVSVFMDADNPAVVLQNAYEIVFDDENIKNHPKTTEEIKRCCEDIKVLGKKEIRNLISWWKAYRDEREEKMKEKSNVIPEPGNEKEVVDDADHEVTDDEKELDEITKQIDDMMEEERKELKRKRKKVNKERAKLQMKMNLNMRQKGDLGPTEGDDEEIFKLSQIASKTDLSKITDQKPDVVAESDDEAEKPTAPKKIRYDTEKSYLDDSGLYYRSEESEIEEEEEEIDSEEEGLGLEENSEKKKKVRFSIPDGDEDSVLDDDDNFSDKEEPSHPLITDLDNRDFKDKRISKAQLWFDKDIFKDVELEEDEDYELDKMASIIKMKGGKIIGDSESSSETTKKKVNNKAAAFDDEENSDMSDGNTEEPKKTKGKQLIVNGTNGEDQINEWDVDPAKALAEKKRKKKEKRTLDAEGLALGTLIATSKKAKRDITDAGWNRYAFNDENLPEWFVEDEEKYMRKEVPVPKELVDEYVKNREELNVRPMKKVIEAKARKKRRVAKRMDKLKNKLEGVMDNPDMTDAEKVRQARQMYKKLKQPRAEVKYLVAKKHTSAKRIRRPKGLKGPYKVVDPRMKKDLRGKINKETKNKSKKKVNKIKKTYKPKNKRKSR